MLFKVGGKWSSIHGQNGSTQREREKERYIFMYTMGDNILSTLNLVVRLVAAEFDPSAAATVD